MLFPNHSPALLFMVTYFRISSATMFHVFHCSNNMIRPWKSEIRVTKGARTVTLCIELLYLVVLFSIL
jgi:hypothetical protein